MSIATRNAGRGGKASRGGRGSSRGGRGRGGGRGGFSRSKKDGSESKGENGHDEDDGQAGEKRKRAVEPDGPADSGVRGTGIPVVQSAKKAKTEEAPVATAAS